MDQQAAPIEDGQHLENCQLPSVQDGHDAYNPDRIEPRAWSQAHSPAKDLRPVLEANGKQAHFRYRESHTAARNSSPPSLRALASEDRNYYRMNDQYEVKDPAHFGLRGPKRHASPTTQEGSSKRQQMTYDRAHGVMDPTDTLSDVSDEIDVYDELNEEPEGHQYDTNTARARPNWRVPPDVPAQVQHIEQLHPYHDSQQLDINLINSRRQPEPPYMPFQQPSPSRQPALPSYEQLCSRQNTPSQQHLPSFYQQQDRRPNTPPRQAPGQLYQQIASSQNNPSRQNRTPQQLSAQRPTSPQAQHYQIGQKSAQQIRSQSRPRRTLARAPSVQAPQARNSSHIDMEEERVNDMSLERGMEPEHTTPRSLHQAGGPRVIDGIRHPEEIIGRARGTHRGHSARSHPFGSPLYAHSGLDPPRSRLDESSPTKGQFDDNSLEDMGSQDASEEVEQVRLLFEPSFRVPRMSVSRHMGPEPQSSFSRAQSEQLLDYVVNPTTFSTPQYHSQFSGISKNKRQLLSEIGDSRGYVANPSSQGGTAGPSAAPQLPSVFRPIQQYEECPAVQMPSTPPRSRREIPVDTPSMQRDQSQSRMSSARQSARIINQGFQNQSAHFRSNHVDGADEEMQENRVPWTGRSIEPARELHAPETPVRVSPQGSPQRGGNFYDGGPVTDSLINAYLFPLKRSAQSKHQDPNAGIDMATNVLPKGSLFGKKSSFKVQAPKAETIKPETPESSVRLTSGRGLEVYIDLCTPPSTARPVPMKDRLTPAAAAKKPAPARPIRTKKPAASAAPVPVKKVPKIKEPVVDPESLRQQRAAEIIVEKELKGRLGEPQYDQVAEDKKVAEARAASQREREEKLAALLRKEEAAKVAEEEKQKRLQEEAAKRKIEKEQEEERKKIKRDAERRKQQVLEQQEKEILRKKAEERIRATRIKEAEEQRQKEVVKQRAKHAEAQELAKVKARQEQARKQAATLSASKLPPVPEAQPADNSNGDDIERDFESLFVEEVADPPAAAPEVKLPSTNKQEVYGSKTAFLENAAKVFAQSASTSTYRANRDAEDAKLAAERAKAAREKLDARWKAKTQASKPDPPRPAVTEKPKPPPRPEPATEESRPPPPPTKAPPAPKKDRPPPKPKVKPEPKPTSRSRAEVNSNFDSESSSSSGPGPTGRSLDDFAPKPSLSGLPGSLKSSGGSKTKPKSPQGPKPKEYAHKVKLISELEREELEKAENEKRSLKRKTTDKRNREHQQAEERRKRDEKAREKKVQELTDTAEKNGAKLTEKELNKQVDKFMEKREKQLEKRRINHRMKENGGDHTALAPQSQQDAESDDESLSPDTKLRRHIQREFKIAQSALGVTQQAMPFDRSKGTIAEYSDPSDEDEEEESFTNSYEPPRAAAVESDESEEDPDNEPEAFVAKPPSKESQDTESEEDSDDADTELSSPPPQMGTYSKAIDEDQRREFNGHLSSMINIPNPSRSRLVYLYQVMKHETTRSDDDKDDQIEVQMVEQFLSQKDANQCARDLATKYRNPDPAVSMAAPHKSITERFTEKGLFKAIFVHDDLHQTLIFIKTITKLSSEFPPEALAHMPTRLPPQAWSVMLYKTTRTTNSATGEVEVQKSSSQQLSCFSILQMANFEACKQLIEMVKPASADDVELMRDHDQNAAQMRESREDFDRAELPFELELEISGGDAVRLGATEIEVKVEPFEIQGPLN
ncbi:hypothetical protein MBM_00311 [Drepanopeziza brunnea f. sp. 'multigermtubi' MB_m1]|uniref:Uncharacterized protein n=1 Tax=Marssonina brunnea f. sp. multigermtubi (strain MB_m1) TaxID=1072389 RepID=K1XKU1_MARBU|nr:uncharacterized protein MBM_00311 [Drepanopeziza brunnea f. sp. 'multigermtubi' MB_m1]EKD21198.1 hypothetical protein MBM_00311 [Drepanopeziza brunnea f. sp. 'multigermtubi' MB_m1]